MLCFAEFVSDQAEQEQHVNDSLETGDMVRCDVKVSSRQEPRPNLCPWTNQQTGNMMSTNRNGAHLWRCHVVEVYHVTILIADTPRCVGDSHKETKTR